MGRCKHSLNLGHCYECLYNAAQEKLDFYEGPNEGLVTALECAESKVERLEARSNANFNLARKYKARLDALRGLQRYKAECSDKHALTHRNDPDAVIKASELDAILNPKGGEDEVD